MESIKDSDHGIKIGFSKMDAESEVHMESFVESDILIISGHGMKITIFMVEGVWKLF